MTFTRLDCTRCDRSYPPGGGRSLCDCGAPLFARYDLDRAARDMRPGHLALREPSLWRYADVLPVEDPAHRVTLGEGFTPLLRTPRLGALVGLPLLQVKDEGGNPTGSFKARGLALAVSMAKAQGTTDVCLPTAGNAGSALAAYAARGGLRAHVFMPRDVGQVFLMETAAYGAHVELVDGLISDAGKACAAQAAEHGWYDCSTLKEPYRVEGKKTMGYEIAEQMGWQLPDAILYPTGGGTGLIGMWKAFEEMEELGWIANKRPRMVAVQASGCAPIVKAFDEGKETAEPWPQAETIASGLRVPQAVADFLMLQVIRESDGTALSVSDEEMLTEIPCVGRAEGIFFCPEAAACVAALRRLTRQKWIKANDQVVILNTASGLKYLDVI
jgi:threonine synthase